MVVSQQHVTDRYAIYQGDCVEVMPKVPGKSVGLSVYSPPFGGLYNYSSSEQDMSNARSYEEFFKHYEFLVREIARVTKPGRMTAVHCCDVPVGALNVEGKEFSTKGGLIDFPGDVVRLHQKLGFQYHARFAIWKEPLRVAIRTRSKGLTHRQLVKDSTFSNNAAADYMLIFKAPGVNAEPVVHDDGLTVYVGEREVPDGYAKKYAGWKDNKTNKLSQWIWQQYASSFWDDVRTNRVLPYRAARDKEDEKHVHPLQLDVIERCVLMWSNPNDVVLTPFMGVGSEVYGALVHGRRGLGIELKATYYRQAHKNIDAVEGGWRDKVEQEGFAFETEQDSDANPDYEAAEGA